MRKGAIDRTDKRIVCILILTSLFLVLASHATAQPAPQQRTSVQDIIKNQKDMKDTMEAMTHALTSMKDSTDSQIEAIGQNTLLFLFALFFFYKASTALWGRMLKYRHWKNHVTLKSDLESEMTARLREQNTLLSKNNNLLKTLQQALSALTPKPEELKPAVALAMFREIERTKKNVSEQKEVDDKENTCHKKPLKRANGSVQALSLLISLLVIVFIGGGLHFYVFDENIVVTSIIIAAMFILVFWSGVIAFSVKRYILKKTKNKGEKLVKISHETPKEDSDKSTDSENEKKEGEINTSVKTSDEKRRIKDRIKPLEKNGKKDGIFEDLKTRMKNAIQDQHELEEAIREEPIEIEEPNSSKNKEYIPQQMVAKKHPLQGLIPKHIKKPADKKTPDKPLKLISLEEAMGLPPKKEEEEPEKEKDDFEEQEEEEIKRGIENPQEERRIESYLETTIVDFIEDMKKQGKKTPLISLYRALDASKEEIKECIKNSKKIVRDGFIVRLNKPAEREVLNLKALDNLTLGAAKKHVGCNNFGRIRKAMKKEGFGYDSGNKMFRKINKNFRRRQ